MVTRNITIKNDIIIMVTMVNLVIMGTAVWERR